MSDSDWEAGFARSVGVFLNGSGITDRDRRGRRITDESFLLLSTPTMSASIGRCRGSGEKRGRRSSIPPMTIGTPIRSPAEVSCLFPAGPWWSSVSARPLAEGGVRFHESQFGRLRRAADMERGRKE
jgi:hypothetical protein